MAKVEIKKLDVLSVAKVYAVIGVIIGFIIGLFVAIFIQFMGAASEMTSLPGAGIVAGGGLAAIIVGPIIYGIMLFVMGAVGAFIYNVIASKVGGIVFES